MINDPSSDWGRAGLHTNDRLVSVNGATPRTWPEFRRVLIGLRVGDTATFVVRAPSEATNRTVRVPITQYRRPVVRITPLPNPTAKQRRIGDAWMHAK